MEALTLLKYWGTSGGTGGGTTTLFTGDSILNARPFTKCVVNPAAAGLYSDYGFDGPYFDLEFTLSDDNQEAADQTSETTETECGSGAEDSSENENDEEEREGALKFSLTGDDNEDQMNLTFPVSLLKSATKFRVLLPKLMKSNSSNGRGFTTQKNDERENKGRVRDKLLTVNFDVEEVKGPLVSLFARDQANHVEGLKQKMKDLDRSSLSDERNLAKELLLKYLINILKPLSIGVSSRYIEKMKFSGQLRFPAGGAKCDGAVSPPCTVAKKGYEVPKGRSSVKIHNNLQAGLKVMLKHLGKSRSTSAMAAAAPPRNMSSNHWDNSLLELQDGIQGAILHCKRSFNSNREEESAI